MHILHIKHPSSCIRTYKEARIMLARGHQVDAAAAGFGFGCNIYSVLYTYAVDEQLGRLIQCSKADLFHVHTEPDWIVAFVKQHAGNRPVVMDVHDPDSLRTCKPPTIDERTAFEVADGIIHVSEPCREYCEQTHGAGKVPTLVLYSYVNAGFYHEAPRVNWCSVTYEGGLTSLVSDGNGGHYFRNIQEQVRRFVEAGYNMTLFAAGNYDLDSSYEDIGAVVVRNLNYPALLAGMRNHAFGFVGSGVPVRIMKAAMPNKLFEYISQGVVPICWNSDTAGEFCERHNIGIWLKKDSDWDDLPAKLARGPILRRNLLSKRGQWTMEAQADALEKFYQALL